MPNIASLLKSEIIRLARKELRAEIVPVRKAGAGYRREIAALKRKLGALERQVKLAQRAAPRAAARASERPGGAPPTRFVAKGLRSMRVRLGLSAPQLAKILAVSTQSVYNWETKKAVPRKNQLEAIVALRSAGKREIAQKLAASKQASTPKKTKTARKARAKRKA